MSPETIPRFSKDFQGSSKISLISGALERRAIPRFSQGFPKVFQGLPRSSEFFPRSSNVAGAWPPPPPPPQGGGARALALLGRVVGRKLRGRVVGGKLFRCGKRRVLSPLRFAGPIRIWRPACVLSITAPGRPRSSLPNGVRCLHSGAQTPPTAHPPPPTARSARSRASVLSALRRRGAARQPRPAPVAADLTAAAGGPPPAAAPQRARDEAGADWPSVPPGRSPTPGCRRCVSGEDLGKNSEDLGRPWKTLGKPWENLGIARRSRAPEISEILEEPWKSLENLGMVSGDIWAEARQRAGQEQTKGNIKEIRWSEGHWQNLGITSGEPWENLGRPWGNVGKPWKNPGKPWKNLGRTLGNLGRPWNRPAADFWMTAAGAWGRRAAGTRAAPPPPAPPRLHDVPARCPAARTGGARPCPLVPVPYGVNEGGMEGGRTAHETPDPSEPHSNKILIALCARLA
eukprot:gene17592-biopygen4703